MTLGHLGRACARRGRCYYGLLFTGGEIRVRPRLVVRDATSSLPLGLASLCYSTSASVFCLSAALSAVLSLSDFLRVLQQQ